MKGDRFQRDFGKGAGLEIGGSLGSTRNQVSTVPPSLRRSGDRFTGDQKTGLNSLNIVGVQRSTVPPHIDDLTDVFVFLANDA